MSFPILQITKPNEVKHFHLTTSLTIRMLADCLVKSDLGLSTIGQSCVDTLKRGEVLKIQVYTSEIKQIDVEVQVFYGQTVVLK